MTWSRTQVQAGRAHEKRPQGALGLAVEVSQTGIDMGGGNSCARSDTADRDGTRV